ncbi:MAG TPA: aminotransferase class I/II-fold pyridoxal phosphate-dependent enzyme [Saprospiraceae bacterium]|nr:aminotransferase class I/II-fold pyridoxal phosphate-dependent enzyme [Saprospiraceae bacterium]
MISTASRLGEVKEYYFSRKLREIAGMNAEGDYVLNLGIGSPDLDPSEKVIDALNTMSRLPYSAQYQSYKGISHLRIAFAKWYEQMYHVALDPESEVLPLMGSKEGIMHLSMAYLESGDEVLVPNPGYPTYKAAAKLAGAKVLEYPLSEKNNWLPDMDFLRMFSLRRVKMMWINYPHMPTGAPMDTQRLKELVDFAKAEKILLCHDNPYSFILNDNPQSIFNIAGAKEVAVELNSLSKSHNMAGMRVGVMTGQKAYIDAVMRFKTNMDSGMYLPIQHAAIAALKLDKNWYQEQNDIYKKRRAQAWKIFDYLGCSYAQESVGLFVWAKIPDAYPNAEVLADRILAEAKVFITPGTIFGSNGNRYLRISLTSSASVFAQAFDRIKSIEL